MTGLHFCKVLRAQFIADRTEREREREREGKRGRGGEGGRGTLGPERTASNLFLVSKHLNELPLARLDSMNGLSIVLSNAFLTTKRPLRNLPTSAVLSLCIVKKAVTEDNWSLLKKATNVKIFNESFGDQYKLSALDIFRIQCVDDVYQALVRVKEEDTESWMSCQAPFTLSPMGDQMKSYRLIWDKTIETLQQSRERFGELPGYLGSVCTCTGQFAGRFREADFSKAAQLAGKNAGTTYRIVGLPVDVAANEVTEIMQEVGWEVEPKEGSRRIRKGTATWLVSAAEAPPSTAFAITFGHGELVRLQVETLVKQFVVQPKQPDVLPTSWIQVASRSLGAIKKPDDETSQPDDEEPPLHAETDAMQSDESELDDVDNTAPLYRPAPKRWAHAKDGRLDSLETAVREMRIMMQQILLNSGQPPSGATKRATPPEDVTGKGKIPWNATLLESIQWTDVPKDGNCVWHSLNVHVNEKHKGYDSGTCAEFKERMIGEMREARQEIARMLGCAPDSFSKTLDAWMPDAVWADARTLLATGMLHASAIVIFNVTEQIIEVMSPWGSVDDTTPLWLFMFDHDHFSPGVAGNLLFS